MEVAVGYGIFTLAPPTARERTPRGGFSRLIAAARLVSLIVTCRPVCIGPHVALSDISRAVALSDGHTLDENPILNIRSKTVVTRPAHSTG